MVILVLSGTSEGVLLADLLQNKGLPFVLSVATSLGFERFKKYEIPLRVGVLELEGLIDFCRENGIKLIIDATHPFAQKVSINAIIAAKTLKISYLRYERPGTEIKSPYLYEALNLKTSLLNLNRLGLRPLITVGVKMLPEFIKQTKINGQKPVVKILPTSENFKLLDQLQVPVDDRLAFWGPGKRQLMRELINYYSLTGLLTKESGDAGGEQEKVASFLAQRLPVILIKRPRVEYPLVVSDLRELEQFLTAEVEKWKKQ